MPKPRSNRSDVRKERKRKRQELQAHDPAQEPPHREKKQRTDSAEDGPAPESCYGKAPNKRPEVQYFGTLDEQVQEAFHDIDRLLRLESGNEDELEDHVKTAWAFAAGKEIKLACSQSCSRCLERLILLSSQCQKKRLLQTFAGHYMSLIQHRFASHICEALFIQCVPALIDEVKVGYDASAVQDGEREPSVEELFLATLDELEGYLDFLLTDKFGSHPLRVMLMILSGRPLFDKRSNNVVCSKSKEDITMTMRGVQGWMRKTRPVPESFGRAVQKIIADSTAVVNLTTLKVIAKHPVGNPMLQLLLDLDTSQAREPKPDGGTEPILLPRMLPDAPASLSDPNSPATDFIMSLIFDRIGSRLLEKLISLCPGKIFKPLFASVLKPRLRAFAKNETSAYSVIKALERVNKVDLADSVRAIDPLIPTLLERHQYSVITTLFERCQARNCREQAERIMSSFNQCLGWGHENWIPKLFRLDENQGISIDPLAKSRKSVCFHAAALAKAMLSIEKKPRRAIQSCLLKMSAKNLVQMANDSRPTASVLVKALEVSPVSGLPFHRPFVSKIVLHIMELVMSPIGHAVINAVAMIPTSFGVPFHFKQNIMAILAEHDDQLRAIPCGKHVRYTWNMVLYLRSVDAWARMMKSKGRDMAWQTQEELNTAEDSNAQRENIPKEKWKGLSASHFMKLRDAGIKLEDGQAEKLRSIDVARMIAAVKAKEEKGKH